MDVEDMEHCLFESTAERTQQRKNRTPSEAREISGSMRESVRFA